jgi:spore coat polysaccharide biosynthesis predicted glycosyltransferase SpsG
MKIAIITDGNNKLGMGHIYQSMALADMLSNKTNDKVEISFITKSVRKVIDLLKKTRHPVYHYSDDDLIFDALREKRQDRIIFDKLDVSPDLARKIKEMLDAKLIIFTNLTKANEYADVTILADIGSNFKNVVIKDNSTGRVEFFGPKYWLLRPEFYEFKKKKKLSNKSVKNIMLIFGGSDPSNLSSAVLNELLQMEMTFNIVLVLGAAFAHHKQLNIVLKKNRFSPSTVQVVQNLTNVAETMFNSDVVFASPGLSFFEALAVGTPVIGFHQNELQRDVYKGFLTTVDISELCKLPLMIKNKSFIFPNHPFVVSMEIGEGKDEIINEILA